MLLPYLEFKPNIHATAYVSESSTIIGRTIIGKDSSVFFNCTLRGDINQIIIGEESNIQDNSMIHLSEETPTIIGDQVTIGHQCMLHACHIQNQALIGMGSIIMDKAVIPSNSIVGAGSLVLEKTTFPRGYLILGSPAKAVRPLTETETQLILKRASDYVKVKNNFLSSKTS